MQGVLAQYARGPRLESQSGLVLHPAPLPSDIWWLSVGPCLDCEQQRDSRLSLVPAWFRADSGTYLFKQWEIDMGQSSGSHGTGELLGSSPCQAMCFFLLCDIYSMTSFDVKVIKINNITQDSVPAYKKDHTGVGAKITQELLHALSHYLLKYSDLFSNFNSENIKNVLGDHGMSLGITCAWLHDHKRLPSSSRCMCKHKIHPGAGTRSRSNFITQEPLWLPTVK